MAIVRGAGTEIIRCIHFNALNTNNTIAIWGVQHHIYTVLSVIIHAVAVNASGDYISLHLSAYDSLAGTPGATIKIFETPMSLKETFVWNDKFSFNGFEPVDFTGEMNSESDQNAIADQGSATSTRQKLYVQGEHSGDNFDITCTYIDQNNA